MIATSSLRRSGAVVFLVSVALAGGCSSLNKPYPDKIRYGLDLPSIQPTTGPAVAVRVNRVLMNSPFDDRSFVYRTADLTYESDYYNVFVADPSALLTAATIRCLASGTASGAVLPPGTTASCDYRLETIVTDLYGDFRLSAKPAAVVRARFMMLHEQPDTTAIAGEWVLEASEPIPTRSPADLAAGWGRAYASIVQQLAGRMAAAVPVSSPPASAAAPGAR